MLQVVLSTSAESFACFIPSMLGYVVELNQDSGGLVSVSTVQIPFSPQGSPFNQFYG